jgi:hypothetical protein
MPAHFAGSTDHAPELFDTDIRPSELVRLLEELARTLAEQSDSVSRELQDA